MTRLNAYRALVALPMPDDDRRSSRPIEGYETADAEALRIKAVTIKTKRKAKKSKRASSRIDWLKAIHSQRGA